MEELEKRLVNFGRHNSLTYKEFAATQEKYIHWLFRQEWFHYKQPELYSYLESMGLRPNDVPKIVSRLSQSKNENNTNKSGLISLDVSSSLCSSTDINNVFLNDDKNIEQSDRMSKSLNDQNKGNNDEQFSRALKRTLSCGDVSFNDYPIKPQTHNQIQATFLDKTQVMNLVKRILGEDNDYTINEVIFEDISEVDLVIDINQKEKRFLGMSRMKRVVLLVEIKVSVSSDYPEVLRQMRKQLRSYKVLHEEQNNTNIEIKQVLLTKSYTGDVTLQQVKGIFGNISFELF